MCVRVAKKIFGSFTARLHQERELKLMQWNLSIKDTPHNTTKGLASLDSNILELKLNHLDANSKPLQWNLSIKDTLNKGHLSNEGTV